MTQLPDSRHSALMSEVQALELECKKAELKLKLQHAKSDEVKLELKTLELEETLRSKKRLAHDEIEQDSAEKRRKLKMPLQDTEAQDSAANHVGHQTADELPNREDEARKATVSRTSSASDKALTRDARAGGAATDEKDLGTITSQTAAGEEVAEEEAALEKAASETAIDHVAAASGGDQDQDDDAQPEEPEEPAVDE